jgi:hypothetical protein
MPKTAQLPGLLVLLPLICCAPAVAREPAQSLDSQASDPTASLMSFQLQDFYSPRLHNSNDELNVLQLRASIPFKLGSINNIARLTLPYVTDSPSGDTGLGDATLFNLAAFDRDWGRFGIGVVALLPVGTNGVSTEKWGLGPAFGFVARPEWGLAGLFNQNIFSVAGDSDRRDVNISTIQPVLNFGLVNNWSIGASEMTVVYDWEASKFTSLPLGMKIAKLTRPGDVPVQWQISYEHNFYDDAVGPSDTFGLTIKLLLPR